MKPIQLALATAMLFSFCSCARLYHVQMGDIDSRDGNLVPFEIKLSEIGINIHEAADIGKAISQNPRTDQNIETIETIISLFQVGPKTGNVVYSEKYADAVFTELKKKCPSGRMTGLVSIREQRKYPVISGEIVKVLGYCIEPEKRTGGHTDV